MSENNLWQAVLAQIELTTSPASFATWFKNTQIKEKEGEKVFVSVPNSFVKEWLESKYKKTILKIIGGLKPDVKKLEFVVDSDLPARPQPPTEEERVTPQPRLEVFTRNQETGLNPHYTFENFVVGSFNELAHAAASAVSEKPGALYNPLFLYGRVGLGKTHLLQAIGNKAITVWQDKKVRYIPTERFVSDIISSIQNGTIASLKKEYRQIDVLIIDDVQFLAGKEKTQEEFFHVFNTLYQKANQIVLSSDRPPKAIHSLTKRLRSRFEGGMIADIGFPDFETRMAILKTKTQEKDEELSPEIYEYLAQNVKTNIRELEGALNRLILFKKVRSEELDLEKVKGLTKDFTISTERKITPQKIINTVSSFFDVSEKELLSSSRKKEVVRPRQIAMYLMREKLETSYPSIGKNLGGRDHTTALYACNKIKKKMDRDEDLKRDIRLIEMQFTGT